MTDKPNEAVAVQKFLDAIFLVVSPIFAEHQKRYLILGVPINQKLLEKECLAAIGLNENGNSK